ncbi:MAG: phosphotransferase [Gammaproteobacteria bacterium]
MKDLQNLEQAARRVFGEIVAFDAQPLSDDGSNRSWLVTHDGVRCIGKFPEQRVGLTIAPGLEYELLQLAADAGIAPRPVGFDSVTGICFVEELAASAPLSAQQANQSPILSRVGQSLRALHSLSAPESLRSFDPLAFADEYCAGIHGSSLQTAHALRAECAVLTAQCAHLLSGVRVCHNDLHAGNVLVGERIWLIDFEYAVRAAPIVDVASYLAYNNLETAAALSLAQASLGTDLPFTETELQLVAGIHRLLGELWELARSDNNASS